MSMEEPWSFTKRSSSQSKKVRFNLLALEHGEYYFQDYSAYSYPSISSSTSTSTATPSQYPRPRQQGRLKLCSRGLLFEPADRLLPLVKYPFRHMETQMERVAGISGGSGADVQNAGRGGGGRVDEGFRFRCTIVVESRRNDEVGPYKTKKAGGSGAADEWSDWTFSFSLLHTPLGEFLGEARRLREVALRVKERGHGYEEPLLNPLLEERLRDSTRKFDTIHLVDFRETLLLPCPVRVDRITPLLRNPGCIMVTDARVYFQPAELNNVGEPVASFALAGVLHAFKRRHMLRQTGLELFMEGDGGSAFFNFESSKQRDELFDVLMSQPLVGPRAQSAGDIEKETRKWQAGQVSNYDYLVFLNTVAGRTVNDLTQYPVFPWVLRDFHSPTLNLDDPSVYRDLSRPIGALNAERLEYFRDRLSNMPDPALHPNSGLPPPFLYGTHYSTPGYTLFFLVRAAPEEMLCLQNGRFDDPDRSFISVKGAWDSVLNNHADLKELIPEFYAGDGAFLTNKDDLPLGVTQSGQRVGDVGLPPWARNPRDFVRKMRRALESPHVSRRLHLWIDLIFGCRQRGRAAIDADNLFYHLTYEGAVDLERIDDPRERAALESQISEFGQCPSQLFRGPHPRRDAQSAPILLQNPVPTAMRRRVAGAWGDGDARLDPGRGGDGMYIVAYGGEELRRECEADGEGGVSRVPGWGNAQGSSRNGDGVLDNHSDSDLNLPRHEHLQHQHLQHQHQQQPQPSRVSFSAESRRAQSSSPLPLTPQFSSVGNASSVGSAVGNAVGSSVGALWKRGWAMAGAVGGAAAEAAGSRGGMGTLNRWPGGAAATAGQGDGAEERQGSGGLGLPAIGGGFLMTPVPPISESFTDNRSSRLELERLERARSAPTNDNKHPPLVSGDYENRLHHNNNQGGISSPSGGLAGDKEAALLSQTARQLYQQHDHSTGHLPSSATAGVSNRESSADGPLSSAVAVARGRALWGVDPARMEIDVRPGQPMAVHQDGVTCLQLVVAGARSAQQRERSGGGDGGRSSPTCPSYEDSGVSDDSGGVCLTLCTSSKDCSLKICSLKREAGGSGPVSKAYTRRRLAGGELPLSCCAMTSDGKHVVAGSWDNGLLLYSVQAAAVLSKVEGAHEDGVRCLALHEDTTPNRETGDGVGDRLLLATGSWDAAVKVWEIRGSDMHMNPNAVLELFDLEAAVQALAFDGTGKLLAAGSEDGVVAVWDVSTGALLATFSGFEEQSPVVSIYWTGTSTNAQPMSAGRSLRSSSVCPVEPACLVLASEAGEVCRYSALGAPLGTLMLDCEVAAMESDGRCTVVACKDGSLRLLSSLDKGGFVQRLVRESGHEEDMSCLHVCTLAQPAGTATHSRSSSNGKSDEGAKPNAVMIVTGSEGGAVRVWDVVYRMRA